MYLRQDPYCRDLTKLQLSRSNYTHAESRFTETNGEFRKQDDSSMGNAKKT